MGKKRNPNKGVFENGEYKLVAVKTSLSPIIYKEMVENMGKLGVNQESAFISMAVKAFNERLNKINLD
jgi:hypothetical protein